MLVNTIRSTADFFLTGHLDHLARIHHEAAGRHDDYIQSVLTSVFGSLPPLTCCITRRATNFQISGWLTVLPLACHQFDMSPQQFCDALPL